ncbi:MAG: hypothetical protein AAF599_15745 [Bacteroidota bacterium]
MRAIAGKIASRHELYHNNGLLINNWIRIFEKSEAHQVLEDLLSFWAKSAAKPTILFVDEVDTLIGDTLISLLRQVRSGYDTRPTNFPHSIILCGVRDVRDYRIHSSSTKEVITGGSAFNIKAESLRLANFSKAQIEQLYQQHTTATGQIFEEGILDLAWYYTEGQPWLVNALAHEVTDRMRENRDRSRPITVEAFEEAKERLILRRDMHFDKLQKEQVKNVVTSLFSSENIPNTASRSDLHYAIDFGVIIKEIGKDMRVSNSIYQEVLSREFTCVLQDFMT